MFDCYLETYNKSHCCGCSACSLVCPVKAITMALDIEGFLYPKVNKDKCIHCNICIKKCCFKAFNDYNTKLQISEPHNSDTKSFKIEEIEIPSSEDKCSQVKCYAVKHKNDEIRRVSSSGGFFPALAKYVIQNKGFVVGAAFDVNNVVCHRIINSVEEISRLQGSKYVVSRIDNTYSDVKHLLEENKLVLFTGTPCQNAGLLNYLDKRYENLITADLVCHGTPSPKLFHDYLKFIENKYRDKIKSVIFRDKIKGWHIENMTIIMNKKKYSRSWQRDPYYLLFLKNHSLRPSCYKCSFAKHERISDITMADFWGIEKIKPQFDDNKGTSFIIINTLKGRELFNKIKDEFLYENASIDDSKQPMLNHPSIMPKSRNSFFKDYINKRIKFSFKKYADYTLLGEIKHQIKKIIMKILNFHR